MSPPITPPARRYFTALGGLPPQSKTADDKAIFTNAYMLMPHGVMSDIVTSFLPHWQGMRMWVLARPMTGFAETFSHYLVELAAGGGSDQTEDDPAAEAVLFVVGGHLTLTIDGTAHNLRAGGYAYLPPGAQWTIHNNHAADDDADSNDAKTAHFHWIRKRYQPVVG